MEILEARRELRAAWAAVPFDMKRVASATAVLLELCDYDLEVFAFGWRKPQLVSGNGLPK